MELIHPAFEHPLGRDDLVAWYRRAGARTRQLFEIPTTQAYFARPISLRNPVVFYEGHVAAFAVNTLLKQALRRPGIDGEYERLFARGIDPEDEIGVPESGAWPSRREVQAYASAADALIVDALSSATLFDDALLERAEAVFTVIEHELMHQETLLYIFHQLPYDQKRRTTDPVAKTVSPVRAECGIVPIPEGLATLGAERDALGFGWDNEFGQHTVAVGAFEMDRHNVTNGAYLEFMSATGAQAPHFWQFGEGAWFWRGMFELIPLPLDAPVYVTLAEAEAYARWRGMRIPTEAEYHRAAFGTPGGEEQMFPWGGTQVKPDHGNFDFGSFEPLPVGSHPAGASAFGVHDLVGNGWEWTSTPFGPFPGFSPMPSYPVYSADFFDGAHYVLKGASPGTPRELVRRSFRNWFRPNYPYMYATFRCAR